MLNFRIVAALIAAELFVSTVLFPNAGVLLGLGFGAAAGAIIFAVGRHILSSAEHVDGVAAGRLLLLGSVGAAFAVAAFYFVISGGDARWAAAAVLAVSLVVVGIASVRLNRLTAPFPSGSR